MTHHTPSAVGLSVSDKEHLAKADLIHHLSPYYEYHPHSFLHSLKHKLFHSHYHPIIQTEDFQSPPISSFSRKQMLNRTVFALKKIKEFNHHFFNDSEQRILSPMPPGLISYGVYYSSLGASAFIMTWAWRTWTMNYKMLVLFGGLVVANNIVINIPNWTNEMVQNFRRKQLAKKYIDLYGEEFFHDIVDPKCDLAKIQGLTNNFKSHD